VTAEQERIAAMDLPELRELLQKGELTAVKVLEAFLAAAVAANRRTNAVTEFLEDALSRARGLDSLPQGSRGPLHGIPISLKVNFNNELVTKVMLCINSL
jgi:amidase